MSEYITIYSLDHEFNGGNQFPPRKLVVSGGNWLPRSTDSLWTQPVPFLGNWLSREATGSLPRQPVVLGGNRLPLEATSLPSELVAFLGNRLPPETTGYLGRQSVASINFMVHADLGCTIG